MPTRIPITLVEGNTQTVVATITPDDPTDTLTAATSVEAIIKDSQCVADGAAGTVTLTSANPAQIIITTHTATTIVAEIVIPATVTTPTYPRWWHLDVRFGAARRTATYGPVTIVDI